MGVIAAATSPSRCCRQRARRLLAVQFSMFSTARCADHARSGTWKRSPLRSINGNSHPRVPLKLRGRTAHQLSVLCSPAQELTRTSPHARDMADRPDRHRLPPRGGDRRLRGAERVASGFFFSLEPYVRSRCRSSSAEPRRPRPFRSSRPSTGIPLVLEELPPGRAASLYLGKRSVAPRSCAMLSAPHCTATSIAVPADLTVTLAKCRRRSDSAPNVNRQPEPACPRPPAGDVEVPALRSRSAGSSHPPPPPPPPAGLPPTAARPRPLALRAQLLLSGAGSPPAARVTGAS